MRQTAKMRMRATRTLQDLTKSVEELEVEIGNLVAWSTNPEGLLLEYLRLTAKAEEVARLFLLDVSSDQFTTIRWKSVNENSVLKERLWRTIDGDTKAQLDWFRTVIGDIGEEMALSDGPDRKAKGPWRADEIRVFVSHISAHKEFASEVEKILSPLGVQLFVAHEVIEVSQEWQAEIEEALRTAHVLVGLVHLGFGESYWVHQEIGWALGRPIPVLMVRLGDDPKGFPARYQAASARGGTAEGVAATIAVWLTRLPEYSQLMTDKLVDSLCRATSFADGREAALRLEEMSRQSKLSPELLDAIETAYASNNQLFPRHVGGQMVIQILRDHGREPPTSPLY
jgi:hypothetical protein